MNLLTYSPPGGACATSVADGLIAPDPNRFTGMIERVAFAVAIAYVIFLAAAFASGVWLVDAHGFGIQTASSTSGPPGVSFSMAIPPRPMIGYFIRRQRNKASAIRR